MYAIGTDILFDTFDDYKYCFHRESIIWHCAVLTRIFAIIMNVEKRTDRARAKSTKRYV